MKTGEEMRGEAARGSKQGRWRGKQRGGDEEKGHWERGGESRRKGDKTGGEDWRK